MRPDELVVRIFASAFTLRLRNDPAMVTHSGPTIFEWRRRRDEEPPSRPATGTAAGRVCFERAAELNATSTPKLSFRTGSGFCGKVVVIGEAAKMDESRHR